MKREYLEALRQIVTHFIDQGAIAMDPDAVGYATLLLAIDADLAALAREPAPCPHREALEAVSADARRWPCTCGPISPYGEADNRCDNCALQQSVAAVLASTQPCAAPSASACRLRSALQRLVDADSDKDPADMGDEFDLAAEALREPYAAPGEAGDGWDPVARILVDERRDWVRRRMEEVAMEFKPGDQMGIVRRRAPGEAGDLILIHEETRDPNGAVGKLWSTTFDSGDADVADVLRYYRRRAPEREGGNGASA